MNPQLVHAGFMLLICSSCVTLLYVCCWFFGVCWLNIKHLFQPK